MRMDAGRRVRVPDTQRAQAGQQVSPDIIQDVCPKRGVPPGPNMSGRANLEDHFVYAQANMPRPQTRGLPQSAGALTRGAIRALHPPPGSGPHNQDMQRGPWEFIISPSISLVGLQATSPMPHHAKSKLQQCLSLDPPSAPPVPRWERWYLRW